MGARPEARALLDGRRARVGTIVGYSTRRMSQPILALEKISKRFGAVVVATDVDLTLAEGEALGIIGPNGAGKTTLFGIAAGTLAPDAGRVLFAGADVTRACAGAALPPRASRARSRSRSRSAA